MTATKTPALKVHALHPLIPRRALCSSGGMKHGPVHGTRNEQAVTCEKCLAKLEKIAAYRAAKVAKIAAKDGAK